MEAVINMGMIG